MQAPSNKRPPSRITTGMKPPTGRRATGLNKRPSSASMQRPSGRHGAVPPRANPKKTKAIIFGVAGGVLLLVLVIVAATSGGTKGKKKPAEQPIAAPPPPTFAPPPHNPAPDLNLTPPNMEAIKVERASLETRTKTWEDAHWTPLNGALLEIKPDGEKELNALCDAWEAFVHKLQNMDFTSDQAKSIIPKVKQAWQSVREHRDDIALARKKAGQTPPK